MKDSNHKSKEELNSQSLIKESSNPEIRKQSGIEYIHNPDLDREIRIETDNEGMRLFHQLLSEEASKFIKEETETFKVLLPHKDSNYPNDKKQQDGNH